MFSSTPKKTLLLLLITCMASNSLSPITIDEACKKYDTIKKEGDNLVFYCTRNLPLEPNKTIALGLALCAGGYAGTYYALKSATPGDLTPYITTAIAIGGFITTWAGIIDSTIEPSQPYVTFTPEALLLHGKKIEWDSIRSLSLKKEYYGTVTIKLKNGTKTKPIYCLFLPIGKSKFSNLLFQYKEEKGNLKNRCLLTF